MGKAHSYLGWIVPVLGTIIPVACFVGASLLFGRVFQLDEERRAALGVPRGNIVKRIGDDYYHLPKGKSGEQHKSKLTPEQYESWLEYEHLMMSCGIPAVGLIFLALILGGLAWYLKVRPYVWKRH